MEHGSGFFPMNIVIFHSCVTLPEDRVYGSNHHSERWGSKLQDFLLKEIKRTGRLFEHIMFNIIWLVGRHNTIQNSNFGLLVHHNTLRTSNIVTISHLV